MRGFLLESVGGEPRLRDVPLPAGSDLPPGTALARVLGAGVNPVDLAMAADPSRPVPRVVGNEAVVLLDGVRAYAERTVAPHGSFAEQALVDPRLLVPLPDDVPDEAALGLGIAGIAARVTLDHVARLRPGETVVVLGATGAVGQVAVQVARLLGAGRVVGAGRDPDRLRTVADLGADATVVLGGHDDAAALQEATAGGADVVLDLVYGAPLVAALAATRPGARVVSAGRAAGDTVLLPFTAVRGRTLLTHSNQLTDPAPKQAAYAWLLDRYRAGELRVATRALPLDDATQAWRLQAGSPGTKLVLRP